MTTAASWLPTPIGMVRRHSDTQRPGHPRRVRAAVADDDQPWLPAWRRPRCQRRWGLASSWPDLCPSSSRTAGARPEARPAMAPSCGEWRHGLANRAGGDKTPRSTPHDRTSRPSADRAEFEQAAVLAMGPRQRRSSRTDSLHRIQWSPVPSQARGQVVAVGVAEARGAVARPRATFGQVQQQQHVRDELLRPRVECGPPS